MELSILQFKDSIMWQDSNKIFQYRIEFKNL